MEISELLEVDEVIVIFLRDSSTVDNNAVGRSQADDTG
jgi:hypothetical protein